MFWIFFCLLKSLDFDLIKFESFFGQKWKKFEKQNNKLKSLMKENKSKEKKN